MKPMPNGRSRIIFFGKIKILKFSTILLCFIVIWTSTRSGFSEISKNTKYGPSLRRKLSILKINFRNFFLGISSPIPGRKNVCGRMFISILNLSQLIFENFRFSDFWIFRISLYKFLMEMMRKILKSWPLVNFKRLLKSL